MFQYIESYRTKHRVIAISKEAKQKNLFKRNLVKQKRSKMCNTEKNIKNKSCGISF
jgi:hypothetical protein